MRFADLVKAFSALEATPGRLRSTRIVSELFAGAPARELPAIAYLLQGQLRPAYEGVAMGMGERTLVRVIAEAFDQTGPAVARALTRLGDLGLVAESCAGRGAGTRLTVHGAYGGLLDVARASGAGSVERKVRLLTGLLRRASPVEGRYLVRIAQGRLRLGVGDATLLEAAALGALGDRRRRADVESAYNVRPDLGLIVRSAFSRGAKGLAGIAPLVGTPVRPALAQRLPSAAAIVRRLGTVHAEPKYDGFRLQMHRDGDRVWAFSRRLEDVSGMFPDLSAAVRRHLRAHRAIIEGEAVVWNPRTRKFLPFQVTMTRKRTHGVAEAAATHPLRLLAFDLLSKNGRSCLARSQRERHAALAKLVRGTPRDPLAVTEVLVTGEAGELQSYFDSMLRRGLEGIVAKNPDAPYRAGERTYDWIKLKRAYQSKLRDTVDLVIVGYVAGRGRRASLGIGSLLAAVYDPKGDRFRTVAKIGSGPSEREWKALRAQLERLAVKSRPGRVDSLITPDVWVQPKLVVEVLADEITRSPRHACGRTDSEPGYALRFPRMLGGVRRDKSAADATTEREIIDLFRMQAR